VPTEYCDHHIRATICADSGQLISSYCPESSYQTGIYIVGGSSESEDAPYLLTEDFLANACTLHNAGNSSYHDSYSYSTITGLNDLLHSDEEESPDTTPPQTDSSNDADETNNNEEAAP
jgi:penicillin-binding protein 1A